MRMYFYSYDTASDLYTHKHASVLRLLYRLADPGTDERGQIEEMREGRVT
jgi:hypothetical protein